MPDDTTILSLPLILPAQAQKHVTHNEALAVLDLVVQLTVINRTLTTAPALPSIGDRHIVAAGATGPWVGQSGRIALFDETGWQFTQPLPGWRAHVLSEGQTAVFDGLGWETPSDGPLTVTQLGVSATPDATNRLAVTSPATLLNHAGAGHQLKLNKAAAGDTASLLFQTGFSGRAEMGTAGTDDFSVKVSADGSTFFTALEAAAASGQVTLPQPVRLGGQAADPSGPADGTLWLNTTSGEVKVRSAGVTLPLGGGGGVSDGDKGDISVSGGGASWTIDAGVVSLGKLSSIATSTILGRATAGTGSPEALTATQARTVLNVANGATANATDAALRDRATHTGAQLAATISDLAASVAATPAVTANTAKVTNATHTGDVTGATALTIAANAVDNAKLADMAANSVKARVGGSAGDPSDVALAASQLLGRGATGDVAAITLGTNLSMTGSTLNASGGGGGSVTVQDEGSTVTAALGTINFVGAGVTVTGGATATVTIPGGGGGGSPAGASGEIQWNNAGAFAGAADVEIEGGQLRLPAIATPTPPAAGGVKLFGRNVGGRILPAIVGPSGLDTSLQPFMGRNKLGFFLPHGNNAGFTNFGLGTAAVGTATGANVTTTNLHTYLQRHEWLVTTAATTAVAGVRATAQQKTVGGPAAGLGGFMLVWRWAPATGVANASHRAFAGMRNSIAAPTDVNPSTLTGICGMGYDAADANIQFMHNDATGTATKIDLGAAFAKPNIDRTAVYEVVMFCPPGITQALSYEVTNLVSGAVASGTVTTDLPSTTTLLAPYAYVSVGGVSSVVGIMVNSMYLESDY